MKLLIAVLAAVACPYAMLTGFNTDVTTGFNLCLAYYLMINYFTLGQSFINQVSAV